MASTVLADIASNDQFTADVLRESLRKSTFWNTGLITNDTEITRMLGARTGARFEVSYFNDLADVAANISDDTQNAATPNNITSSTDLGTACFRNQVWGAMDITRAMSTAGDPMVAAASVVGSWWARHLDITSLAVVKGVLADNVANDASDMVLDISAAGAGNDTITINTLIDAKSTMGDMSDALGAIVMHSGAHAKLQKDGVTDKVYSDSGMFLYESLLGMRIIVSDNVDVPAAGVYTSYLIGSGMIGYGEDVPPNANEVERNALAGVGGGEESLISRKHFALHPYGFNFTGAPAGPTPTNAEFEAAASWSRNVERKRVPMASLVHLI